MNPRDDALWAFVECAIAKGEATEALHTLELLLSDFPHESTLRRAAVLCLMDLHRYHDAATHLAWLYRHGEAQDPQSYHKFALCLHLSGEFHQCLAICDEALARYPQFSQLFALRGGTWQVLGDYEKMMADCRTAAALDPNNVHARYALALRELMVSNLKKGFAGYADRLFEEHEQPVPFYGLPSWEGEDLRDKTLVVVWEQGIGDIVMFAGFIPYLEQRGARLILTVPEKLYALFARSFPHCEVAVVRTGDMEASLEERADYAVLMGNLMELCLPHYRPAQHPPYLRADHDRSTELRNRYLALHPDKNYLVGIAWHTSNPLTGFLRNIPLEQWRPIFDLPQLQCISLQYHPPATLPHAVYCDLAIDAFEDVDALAAQIMAMDEIITIQNATAHLAGALGMPTTLLLSSASDWRWGIHTSKGTWYDSVHIVRQEQPLIWQPVMAEVAQRLKEQHYLSSS